ncbi:hypothetical protein PEDI_19170 [Persicobacter diffluens]|uniref:Uncharacterized protein n=2 Tax=Persicobacter diffluens TaxID=981 RepID=A0AAN4VYX4_9BACT|nr:hypothetical protein PEDI_19170 [Persicobacter diffluens]
MGCQDENSLHFKKHEGFNQETAQTHVSQWYSEMDNKVSDAINSIDFSNTVFKLKSEDLPSLYSTNGNFKFYPALESTDNGNLNFYCFIQRGDGALLPLYPELQDSSIVTPLKIRSSEFENTGFLTEAMEKTLKERLNQVTKTELIKQFTSQDTNERVEYFEMFEKDYPSIVIDGITYFGAFEETETITSLGIQFGLHESGEENLHGEQYTIPITTILQIQRSADNSGNYRSDNSQNTNLSYDYSNPCPPCQAGIN